MSYATLRYHHHHHFNFLRHFWASGASRLNPARFFGAICIQRCSKRPHSDPFQIIFEGYDDDDDGDDGDADADDDDADADANADDDNVDDDDDDATPED